MPIISRTYDIILLDTVELYGYYGGLIEKKERKKEKKPDNLYTYGAS